jgi:hypothetical protein
VGNIVEGADSALNFTVLLRGIRARHVEVDTMREKERASGGVVKLMAIIALNTVNGDTELCLDIRKKVIQR